MDLEICVSALETICILRKLFADVLRTDEDALQMHPGPLDLHVDLDDLSDDRAKSSLLFQDM